MERIAAFTHRPITLNMLKDRGSSLLYPILAKAASALTSTEFRMMIVGAMKMALVSGSPGLTIGYQSIVRDHGMNREIDGSPARWSAAEICRGDPPLTYMRGLAKTSHEHVSSNWQPMKKKIGRTRKAVAGGSIGMVDLSCCAVRVVGVLLSTYT